MRLHERVLRASLRDLRRSWGDHHYILIVERVARQSAHPPIHKKRMISGSIAVFVGEAGGGRSRSEEKSKSGTFPPRLEILQVRRDFHFSHRLPVYRQGLFDQLLEAEFLQHRGYRKQPSVGRQIPRCKIIGRGSLDFIRLQSICANPLIDGAVRRSLICIAHHLGDSWESVCEALNFGSLLF